MQDIHSIGGGRIFSGGEGGGGVRKLRSQHQQNKQSLKCPRCDSLNTKFCYYNNYNLSQPRHFCKNCRRYWTKGGVLRNVPVGGGCRKAKRSKTKPLSESTAPPQLRQKHKSNSHSSSESTSSLIAANSNIAVTNKNIAAAAATTTTDSSACGTAEVVSAETSHSNNVNVNESKLYGNNYNFVFETGFQEQGSDSGIFQEIGSFTSLVSSSNNEMSTSSFGFGTVLNGQGQWQQQQQKMMTGEEITEGFLDRTVQDELSNLHSRSGSGFGPLDLQESGDQPFFDLRNDVDQTYWNQSHWTDQDHPTLYFP